MIGHVHAFIDPVVIERLINADAVAIVLGGTLLATLAQCGWRDTLAALGAAMRLLARRLDEAANRAALARAVSEFVRRGYLCADLPPPPDAPIAAALESYRRTGLPTSLQEHAENTRTERAKALVDTVRPLDQAAEMAPVFGLVGTLLAITELAATNMGGGAEVTTRAIGTAVLSTLYGVVAANLVFVPLARAIERRARQEETVRSTLVAWAVTHLKKAREGSAGLTDARLVSPARDAA